MQKKHPGESQDHFDERVTEYIAKLDQQVQMNIGRIDNIDDTTYTIMSSPSQTTISIWDNRTSYGSREIKIDTSNLDIKLSELSSDRDYLLVEVEKLKEMNKLLLKYIKESL